MTKPLKVRDRVVVVDGSISRYKKGTKGSVTFIDGDNVPYYVIGDDYAFPQWFTRKQLRKMPDRKEG